MKVLNKGMKVLNKDFYCYECYLQFEDKFLFDVHLSFMHESIRRKVQIECGICDAEFGQREDLDRHVAIVHEGKKPFKCDICYAQFTSKHGMKGHIATIHDGKKTFKCYICNANLGQSPNLNPFFPS